MNEKDRYLPLVEVDALKMASISGSIIIATSLILDPLISGVDFFSYPILEFLPDNCSNYISDV